MAKKKGINLTPEKKKMLKQLIMQKAAADMKKKQEEEEAAKQNFIAEKVGVLDISGLRNEQLPGKCRALHKWICELEEEKYDWEVRLREQELKYNQAFIEANAIKGQFVKPVLKKVQKPQNKLAKAMKAKAEARAAARNMKSAGGDEADTEE